MSDSLASDWKHTVALRSLPFFETLFGEKRNFTIDLWGEVQLPATGPSEFTLVFSHPETLRQVFTPPLELSLGEAYIHRDLDVEGDLIKAFNLLDQLAVNIRKTSLVLRLAQAYLALPSGKIDLVEGRGPIHLQGKTHSKDRDRAAIRYHYDVGNEFYALFLDRSMQYSCAYFPTGTEDLDTAEECKLEHICRKLRLRPGERLLDIGCGWGALVRYAVKHYQVTALGVTLSEKQAGYAQQRIKGEGLAGRARVELMDYRDLDTQSFDKIVSVGMFEHVGRSHLPEYFGQVYRLLVPGGLFLNHGISLREINPEWREVAERLPAGWAPTRMIHPLSWASQRLLGAGTFSQRYIFPDGELVLLSDANLFAEAAGFEVRDVENLREHYALTLRNWISRLDQHREDATRLAGDVTYRTWKLYLSASVHGFESGLISVNQSLLSKTVGGKCIVPMSRADIYA